MQAEVAADLRTIFNAHNRATADAYLAKILAMPEKDIREQRRALGVVQGYEPVRVSGVENAAYYYSTYNAPDAVPDASFCARVMQRIEAQRQASLPYALSQPALGWRLIFAAFTAMILMGSFLVYSERGPAFNGSSLVTIMAADPGAYGTIGSDPQQDRETVLVSLASYQD